jgi:Protein of unknown function (DUF2934)
MNDFVAGNSEELTKKLAYKYWERRGHPFGSPEIDWFAAEKALASSRAQSKKDLFLSCLPPEPYEEPYR